MDEMMMGMIKGLLVRASILLLFLLFLGTSLGVDGYYD